MRTSEKTELSLSAAVTVFIALCRDFLPNRMESGYFILSLGILFLVQTLLRDIWLMYRLRSTPRSSMPGARCMCLESAIGFIPVIAAAALLFSGLSRPVSIPAWAWPTGTAVILAAGFFLKDYVFEWKPFRIRKAPNHINLTFSWRSDPRVHT